MNPALPSGVHQKTLEVYQYIFQMIGKDTLARDLPLYLSGLSSTLSFASLNVRSPFLALLETHLLNLDSLSLRPALKAIILTLLPGLEEETSEDFERTLKLLNGFKVAVRPDTEESISQEHNVGDEYFWQCFFLASITSNGRRLGALAYLVRNLPKLGPLVPKDLPGATSQSLSDDGQNSYSEKLAKVVTSPEPGLLIRCFAAGLADEQILIQRGFLDLLVTHVPIHAKVLQTQVKPEDLERLLIAAAGVVARRDMSLNRRLWTWFLGPELSPESDADFGHGSPASLDGDGRGTSGVSRTQYFEKYGLQPLTRAIQKMIAARPVNPIDRARPFRICLSLMDRWEIGGLVIPEIFLPVVDSVRSYQKQCTTKDHFQEVLRSASVFFDGVESGLIWGEIIGLLKAALGPTSASIADRVDKLALVDFIINNFNVREEEMLVIHLPIAILTVFCIMEDLDSRISRQDHGPETGLGDVALLALNIAADLIDLMPERALTARSVASGLHPNQPEKESKGPSNSDVLQQIALFYSRYQGAPEATPLSSNVISGILLREANRAMGHRLGNPLSSVDIGVRTRLLAMLCSKAPKADGFSATTLLSSMHHRLVLPVSQIPFVHLTSIICLLSTLHSSDYISLEQVSDLVQPLVKLAWSFLSVSHPKYHVEVVRSLWQLQTTLSLENRDIEAALCTIMIEQDVSGTFAVRHAEVGRNFNILWTHSLLDGAGHLDRKPSAVNAEPKKSQRLLGNVNYEVMLGRPVLLILDSLSDERTELFTTVRSWLQTLTGVDRYVSMSKL